MIIHPQSHYMEIAMQVVMKVSCKLLLSSLLTLACSVSAQTLSKEAIAELDQYLEKAIATTHIPGIVALVTNKDSILYESAFGKMDRPAELAANRRLAALSGSVSWLV